jgi:16S rRNA (adenine1518-N6/adenine1519-N6)-dimethyltransferase
MLFTVSANAFNPPPKVESAIVQLIPETRYQQVDSILFGKVVQQAFSQRRKTLRNCLKGWFNSAQLEELGIDPTARAETLELDDFVRLAGAHTGKLD